MSNVSRFLTFPLAGIMSLVPALAFAGLDDLQGTQPFELGAGNQFDAADGCSLCHGGGYKGDESYLPHDAWAGTMMGNAARDPIFRAALAIANQDDPGIGTFCLRCHSPIAFVRGHTLPPDGSAFDEIDMQGVGCDTCHRAISKASPEPPYFLGDAQIVYNDVLEKRGPYADSVAFAHETSQETALSSSEFCGQCHQVRNPCRPLRDAAGVATAFSFPLDTTYEEWASSAFSLPGGQGCIDCHTQRKSGLFPIATTPSAPLRKDPRDHVFAGGNLFGIRAVMEKDPERASSYPEAFSLALARTAETLTKACRIEILAVQTPASPGETLSISVRVENLSGHKFPTGYVEGRRAWIALALTDSAGIEYDIVGGYDQESGEIAASPPTHVYRAQHGHWNGAAPEPSEDIATHDMVLSDTRIPPKGFVPTLQTMPTNEIDYFDDIGDTRHWDEVTFDVTVPSSVRGSMRLVAKLLYQPITREYVEHLAQANITDSSGDELLAIYTSLGGSPPFPVSTAEVMIDFGGGISASSNGSNGSGGSGGENGSGGGMGAVSSESCACGLAKSSEGAPSRAAYIGLWALVLLLRARSSRRRIS